MLLMPRHHGALRMPAAWAALLAAAVSPACHRPPQPEPGAPTVQHASAPRPPREPLIRVLILERTPRLAVAVDGPFEIVSGGQVILRGPHLDEVEVHASAGPAPRIHIGRVACQYGDVHVRPAHSGTLRVRSQAPGERHPSRRYDGQLLIRPSPPPGSAQLVAAGPPELDVLNLASLETYLVGVLAGELYANFHIETFRAQAVAARTYALYQMRTAGRRKAYDVLATEGSQVYTGLDGVDRDGKAWRAVADTRGLVLTWPSPMGQKIFCTYYSSACGGTTQNVAHFLGGPAIPPLRGQIPCDYCSIGGQAYRWGPVELSKSVVRHRLAEHFGANAIPDPLTSVTVQQRTPDGRPLTLRLTGPDKQVEVNSYAFRLALGGHTLRSNQFTIVDQGDQIAFSDGRGFGHAVGMCQWGAEGQARLGRSASSILAHYYPTSKLTRAY